MKGQICKKIGEHGEFGQEQQQKHDFLNELNGRDKVFTAAQNQRRKEKFLVQQNM